MKSKLRLILVILAVLIVLGTAWKMKQSRSTARATVVEVQTGAFVSELLQMGEVQAVNSTNITPRTWGKIANLVPEGTVVEKDQPIAWLETEDLQRNVEKYQVDLELSQKKLQKALENAQLQNRLNELAVQEARASLEYERNQLESARTKLAKTQRLVDAEISPRKALDDAELAVLSQELQLQNKTLALEKALKNQTSQAEIQKADVNAARIDVEKNQAEFEREQDNLGHAVITAPTTGMVLYKMIWKGGQREKVAVGDQVGHWHPFLEIPDLSQLEVITLVDEVDISRLKSGQEATVTLDAFPDMLLTGEITKIASLAQDARGGGEGMMGRGASSSPSGRKVFEVHISINETPEDLRPGVTGRVRIQIANETNALFVPIESVFKDSDGSFVYVNTFTGPVRRNVETGPWNYEYIVIRDGLNPGDKVWLVRPE